MSPEAGRGNNQTLRILLEHRVVDTWLEIKAILIGKRHKLTQVFVANFILNNKNQVVVRLAFILDRDIGAKIHFAAKDRLDICFFRLFKKLNGAKDVSVIAYSNCFPLLLLRKLHKLFNLDCSIQKRVFGMEVEMGEVVVVHKGPSCLAKKRQSIGGFNPLLRVYSVEVICKKVEV